MPYPTLYLIVTGADGVHHIADMLAAPARPAGLGNTYCGRADIDSSTATVRQRPMPADVCPACVNGLKHEAKGTRKPS